MFKIAFPHISSCAFFVYTFCSKYARVCVERNVIGKKLMPRCKKHFHADFKFPKFFKEIYMQGSEAQQKHGRGLLTVSL